jgi:hypothetical protein
MSHIMSIHEYVLKPDADPRQFERAVATAHTCGLLRLPGLVAYHFVKGIKGARRGQYAAIWVYDSRAAWERLWGTLEHPHQPDAYPASWHQWEEEVLAPFLSQDPDRITFTAYEEFGTHWRSPGRPHNAF